MSNIEKPETRHGLSRRDLLVASTVLAATATSLAKPQAASAQQAASSGNAGGRPNILMIMADDIGWFNASIYNRGIMGYRTPNIDRIGNEGGLFTDWYGEQSCTAGRAAYINRRQSFPRRASTNPFRPWVVR